jgi:hypothetical protein
LQVARCACENVFDSHKAATYKMIDQESGDIGALPSLMVEEESYGALTFQGRGEGYQVSDGQRNKAKAGQASLKAKRRIGVERGAMSP